MRRLLLSSVAAVALCSAPMATHAADIGYRPAPPPVLVWNWTGFYVGGHIGAAVAYKRWDDPTLVFAPFGITPFTGESDIGGTIGGFQVGYNFQGGGFLWGLEADVSFADVEGDTRCALALALCNTHVTALGTIAGRLGGVIGDRLLLYVKGGAAWANERYRVASFFIPGFDLRATDTRWGWTLGFGVEYAFTSKFSVKAEYNYLDFGTERVTFDRSGRLGDFRRDCSARHQSAYASHQVGRELPVRLGQGTHRGQVLSGCNGFGGR